jgi:hypothetical protein
LKTRLRIARGAALTTLLAMVFAVPSCAPPEAPDAVVRMDFARTGSIFDAPFPSADLVDENGIVNVSGLPPGGRIAIVDQIHQALVGLHGFGTTSAIHFQLTAGPDTTMLPHRIAASDATAVVQIIDVDPDSPDVGTRIPLELYYVADAGPFGAHARLLTALPTQGWPLRASNTYAVVIADTLLTTTGNRFTPSAAMRALRDGHAPDGLVPSVGMAYTSAVMTLRAHHVDVDHVVGMTVFRTQDPTVGFQHGLQSVRGRDSITFEPFTLDTTYPTYCTFHSIAHVPVYQTGTPPYLTSGGGWTFDQSGALQFDHHEDANVLITFPRTTMPTDGFPLVTVIRTGAGGDRPLVDRGIQPSHGAASPPGTGPAMHFAAEGIAGIQIDGPHGGLRNVSGMDEQFLVFNIQNPTALRDNLRESALELDLLVDALSSIHVSAALCPGLTTATDAHVDVRHLALLGHSMGASIAPLAAAFEPRYGAIVLSGAGASWTENVIYKLSPLPVRTVAQGYLGYTGADTRILREDDPVVNWLQWAGEESDAAVYAPFLVRDPGGSPRHILMFQGIVDTYIMPPIANAMTISTGLDLAGPAIDRMDMDPRIAGLQSILDVLPLRGRTQQSFPVSANLPVPGGGMVTGAVVQHMSDGIEDGHEVMWQLPDAQTQYRCFLRSYVSGAPPVIVDPAVGCP